MPKHTKKAKNAKNTTVTTRPFILKTENQEYAIVTKMFGDCRVECKYFNNKVKMGIIRNKMRKGKANKIKLEDIVIVSERDFQEDKVDIIHVYTPEEVVKLRRMKQIPELKKETDTDIFEFVRETDPIFEKRKPKQVITKKVETTPSSESVSASSASEEVETEESETSASDSSELDIDNI